MRHFNFDDDDLPPLVRKVFDGCDRIGDCYVWRGFSYNSGPVMWWRGKATRVRRALLEAAGIKLGGLLVRQAHCEHGEKCCNMAHFVVASKQQVSRELVEDGRIPRGLIASLAQAKRLRGRGKFSDEQIRAAHRMFADGADVRQIAASIGASVYYMRHVLAGRFRRLLAPPNIAYQAPVVNKRTVARKLAERKANDRVRRVLDRLARSE